jgi:type 1 glutamine amidotransferase
MAFPLQMPACMFEEVTLTTPTGAMVSGRWVAGASTAETIRASVQPAGPRDLLHLPEGDRTKAAVKIYTDGDLSEGNEALQTLPQLLTWNSEQWQIQKVWRHALGIGHHKGLAMRLERT